MPDLDALFRTAKGLHERGEFRAAASLYEEILRHRQDAGPVRDNLALAWLGAGDWARGWPAYDRRFTRPAGTIPKPTLPLPEWSGEPIEGRSLLIWDEQGYGDQIMFARFVPQLAAMGAQLTLVAPRPLVRLFTALPCQVVEKTRQMALRRHDFWIMAGSIPGRLGVTVENLPNAPYLTGCAGGDGIGVAWRGDPKNPVDDLRSLGPGEAKRLLSLPGAQSLLPEDTGARDFEDTAERIRALRLVITVDTSIAHLAGAMGKPTWILLRREKPCWRWLSERTDTPWYPSARLFRQPEPRAWGPVLDAIEKELARP